ncbi:MAG: TonB family protein [Candidatus Sulfotelmatobacter sp.]|jgi:TonB family protein
MSPELSAGLALDVVLNEIVEQACRATGATGAAVILERDGEMVCRASTGGNAPELGARLSRERGLTAECIKTRQAQRCDDAQADPRADVEASRSLGVRSVVVLPLIRKGDLAGILEVFSSRIGAFGERDELTLEALANRILKNLERGSEPYSTAAQNPVMPATQISGSELEDWQAESSGVREKEGEVGRGTVGRSPRTGLDVVTFVLGVVVVACAVLLGTLVGLRLGWRRTAAVRGQVMNSASGAAVGAGNRGARADATPHGTAAEASGAKVAASAGSKGTGGDTKNGLVPPRPPVAGRKDSLPPPGELLVYENGKEVFRMPPTAEEREATDGSSTHGAGVQRASDVGRAGPLQVAPEVAEGSLLHRVEPDYPEQARQQQIQGPVVLDVRTRRDGTIQELKLLSGQRLLADAAIAAVKQWRFRPQLVKGEPVEMQTTVTLNFKLPR